MATVENNIFIRGLRGALGRQFVVKRGRNRSIVSSYPVFDENRSFTEAQVKQQSRFREAVEFAKSAKGWAVYVEKARADNRTPYHVAISDFCHAPEIVTIDPQNWQSGQGGAIHIKAVDDVQVTQVKVAITDKAGTVLEEGAAVQTNAAWWSYTPAVNAMDGASIMVTAFDLAGNMVEANKVLD
ncbi:MAG: hypothetical protein IH588_19230 [Anaerolineales bacterium]|nr:hypothetical protein [Anaerolineales bacterium]